MIKHAYLKVAAAVVTIAAATAISTSASANPLNPFEALFGPLRPQVQAPAYAAPSEDTKDELRADLRRQVVNYRTSEAPGTIIIDTPNTFLYLVMPGGKAMRYGIGVGREASPGPAPRRSSARPSGGLDAAAGDDPAPAYLPRFVAGGDGNPLGARAMYLSGSVYRIHGATPRKHRHTRCRRAASGCSTRM